MKKRKISIILNSLIIISSTIGLYLSFNSTNFMSANSILYYTIQSNIFCLISAIVMIIFDIKALNNKKYKIPNFVFLLKYITTVAITITLVVFTVLLIPQMIKIGNANYLSSLSNITLHFATPILAIISLFICDNDLKINKKTFLAGAICPLYYLFFSLFLSVVSKKDLFVGFDGSTSKFPYFFLDYHANGWFKIGTNMFEIGTFYYIVIILIFVLLLSKLYTKVIEKRNK